MIRDSTMINAKGVFHNIGGEYNTKHLVWNSGNDYMTMHNISESGYMEIWNPSDVYVPSR